MMSPVASQKGFTLVEVLMSSVLLSLILLAIAQTLTLFVRSSRQSEKAANATAEVLDLSFYVQRSSKNLTLNRLDLAHTYLWGGGAPQAVGGTSTPSVSLQLNLGNWLQNGAGHRFYSEVSSKLGTSAYSIYLDSFTLEEHGLRQNAGAVKKITRRLLVSRCEHIDRFFKVSDLQGSPSVTALYVLGVMPRRPFVSYSGGGGAMPELRCCPAGNPQCADGAMKNYFFRMYSITLRTDQEGASTVEEFPKPIDGTAALGSGFALYFLNRDGSNVAMKMFSLSDRCKVTMGGPTAACQGLENVDLKRFMDKAAQNPHLIKMDLRSFSTSLSNDIANTGVISL